MANGSALILDLNGIAQPKTLTGMISITPEGQGNINPKSVDSTVLADNAVTTIAIADGSITSNKVADKSVQGSKIVDNAISNIKLAAMAPNTIKAAGADGVVLDMTATQIATMMDLAPKIILQVVSTSYTSVATGSTVIPLDNTKPQSTEGTQFMAQTITPKNASSYLRIDIYAVTSVSLGVPAVIALFQDAGVDALAAIPVYQQSGVSDNSVLSWMVASGSSVARTFKMRAGPTAALNTLTFNGNNGTQLFGGTCASRITITEIMI